MTDREFAEIQLRAIVAAIVFTENGSECASVRVANVIIDEAKMQNNNVSGPVLPKFPTKK